MKYICYRNAHESYSRIKKEKRKEKIGCLKPKTAAKQLPDITKHLNLKIPFKGFKQASKATSCRIFYIKFKRQPSEY